MLIRKEINVANGETLEIEQYAYKNADGDVLVLDAGESVPDGYEKFTPEPVEEAQE